MIERKYPNQFLLGPYQLWTYPIPYAKSRSYGEIKRRLIVIFDRGYDLADLNEEPELPSTFCPYFAFFTSNEGSKFIEPNIYIDYPETQDFHLRHPSTLNISASFLSYDDNTVTVEDIEKNGNFIGELNEKAINILLSHSDDIERVVKYKLLTMDAFKEVKAQDEKWISENVTDKPDGDPSSPPSVNNSVNNQDIDEALFNSKISKVDQIDNLIEDIYNLRKEGMEEDGEYSIKNLIFKEFRNLGYLDNLKELRKKEISKELSLEQLQECSLLESKQDIDAFIDKFGQDTYDEFKKSSQRLKNANYSTDIIKYTKDDSWTKEKLDKLLFNLSNKLTVSKDDSTKIEGKYRDLGIHGNYHIYEPLDALASMNLGVGSGWCTAGRYEHYGDKNFKPSLKAAKEHWDEYTGEGVRFFYYLDKNTNLAKYAIAVYPRILVVDEIIGENYISVANFEIYNAEDELEYGAFNKLPTDNLGVELILDIPLSVQNNVIYTVDDDIKTKFAEIKGDTLYIEDGVKETVVLKYILSQDRLNEIRSIIIPNSVEGIGEDAFSNCSALKSIVIPNSVKWIGGSAFYNCTSLESIILPNSFEEIGEYAFSYCTSLKSINIPNSVKEIEMFAFDACESLESIVIPNSVEKMGHGAFYKCPNLTIYCEIESQPSDWNSNWNPFNQPVVWGYKKRKQMKNYH